MDPGFEVRGGEIRQRVWDRLGHKLGPGWSPVRGTRGGGGGEAPLKLLHLSDFKA